MLVKVSSKVVAPVISYKKVRTLSELKLGNVVKYGMCFLNAILMGLNLELDVESYECMVTAIVPFVENYDSLDVFVGWLEGSAELNESIIIALANYFQITIVIHFELDGYQERYAGEHTTQTVHISNDGGRFQLGHHFELLR